jgi:peptide/nickel transport system ATP-binding protein
VIHDRNIVRLRDHPELRSRPPTAAPLLTVRDLCIADDAGHELVRHVGFEIRRGGTLGIVGESGSGKSLTCRAILDVLSPGLTITSGEILYDGTDLTRLSARDWRPLRGLELSAIFQDPGSYLNPSIAVGTQLTEALRATLNLDRKAARARAIALLRKVGLTDAEAVYRQYPFELSGGMAQRVLIAVAVSAGPHLLIADEATTALDVTVQAEVLKLLDELRREQQLTLILVSHDLAVVAQHCDDIIVMRDGAIVEAGPTEQVLHHPRDAYTRTLLANHHVYSIPTAQPSAPVPVEKREPLLAVRGLKVGYGRRTVLDGIEVDIGKGEILGLIGETGSGKTTFFRALLGLAPPTAGSIQLEDQRLDRLRGKALRDFRRANHIHHVFQDPLRSLDPDRTVAASVGEGLDIRGGIGATERASRINEALRAVGLDAALADRLPDALSGGQRQRVLIARALVLEPSLLLLDEPVSALDSVNRIHVLNLLRDLARDRGIAQIFISHDLGSVAGIADTIAVLNEGRIVEYGPAAALLSNPTHPYTRALIAAAPRIAQAPLASRREPAPAVLYSYPRKVAT